LYKQLCDATLISKQQLEIQSLLDWNFTCILNWNIEEKKKKHDQSASTTWHKKPYLSTHLILCTRLIIFYFIFVETKLHWRLLKCFVLEHSVFKTFEKYCMKLRTKAQPCRKIRLKTRTNVCFATLVTIIESSQPFF
jgi:hypothetical protein